MNTADKPFMKEDASSTSKPPIQVLGIGKASIPIGTLREKFLLGNLPYSNLMGLHICDYPKGSISRMKFPGKMYLSFRNCPDKDVYEWMGRWCVEKIRDNARLLVFAASLQEELGCKLLPSVIRIARSLSIPTLAAAVLPDEKALPDVKELCSHALGAISRTGSPTILIDRNKFTLQYGMMTPSKMDELSNEYIVESLLTLGRIVEEGRKDSSRRDELKRFLREGGRIQMSRGLSEPSEGVSVSLSRATDVPSAISETSLQNSGYLLFSVEIATDYAEHRADAQQALRSSAAQFSLRYPANAINRPSPRVMVRDVSDGKCRSNEASVLAMNRTVLLSASMDGHSPGENSDLLLDDLFSEKGESSSLPPKESTRLERMIRRQDERRNAYLDYLYRRYHLYVEKIGTPPPMDYEGKAEYVRMQQEDCFNEDGSPVIGREYLCRSLGILGFTPLDSSLSETNDVGNFTVEFIYEGMLCILAYITKDNIIVLDVPQAMGYDPQDEDYVEWICGKMFEEFSSASCDIDNKGNVTLSCYGPLSRGSGIVPFLKDAILSVSTLKSTFLRMYQENYDSLEWRIYKKNRR